MENSKFKINERIGIKIQSIEDVVYNDEECEVVITVSVRPKLHKASREHKPVDKLKSFRLAESILEKLNQIFK